MLEAFGAVGVGATMRRFCSAVVSLPASLYMLKKGKGRDCLADIVLSLSLSLSLSLFFK